MRKGQIMVKKPTNCFFFMSGNNSYVHVGKQNNAALSKSVNRQYKMNVGF